MLRRLLIAAVLVAGFGAFAAPHARAATIPCPDTQTNSISSTHFLVSFDDVPGGSSFATKTQAQEILAGAEQAYKTFVGMGFTAPWSGSQMEIDIADLSSAGYSFLFCNKAFVFNTGTLDTASADVVLYASVFTQFAMSAGVTDDWLIQSLAQWAAYKALGYPAGAASDLGPWEISLDCTPTVTAGVANATCSKTPYENQGQSRWAFIEYLAEKYGTPGFISELMGDAAATGGVTGLQTALTAHGSSLAAEYSNFAAKLITGGWTATPLNVTAPTVSGTVQAGAATGDTAPQTFRIGHLAARFIQIDRGDGDASHKCYTATLTITVNLPAGVTSQPVFYWATAGSSSVPLSVSGTTATATVPWDTCKWNAHGYLSLPNATTNVDDAYFTVSTHLAVTSTETTATAPSTPANSYGNSTDATSAVGAPVVSLRGPSTLKLTPTDTTLDLVVEASDQGTISAKLGALDLGTKTIVPGENAIHFSIPAGSTGTLTVTPTSADGKTVGTPVTLTVAKVAPTTVKKLTLRLKRAAKKPKLKFAAKAAKKPKQ